MRIHALGLAALVLVGCNSGGNIDTKEAVRQGVIDYLAGRQGLNVGSMNVDVTSVSFKQNEAEAMVAFVPKGSQGGQGMSMRYTLERKGNRWVVKGRSDSAGQNPHGAMPSGENPHGAMPPGAAPETPGALPPGHPAVPKK